MTPAQKVEDVIKTVREARRWYERAEFVGIVNLIWDAMEASENVAKETTTPEGQ